MTKVSQKSLNEEHTVPQRPKIVLAAVLKPVDDTRMFEKFALSLSANYEVHIIGFEASIPPLSQPNIYFHPIFRFHRTSNHRLQASQLFWQKLKALKPQLLIVHAVELLPMACWYGIRYRIPVCYDVRENYYRNILFQNHYPIYLKFPLALMLRAMEWLSRLKVAHYFMAERNYEQEFSFSKGKSTVLENKYKSLVNFPFIPKNESLKHFVYTGTISTIYGAKEAFILVEKLYRLGQVETFTMIGKAAEKELADWFKKQAQQHSWFKWKGTSTPIAHTEIIQALAKADMALLPYQANKSTMNCIPTKLYECLALGIPMLIQQNALWEAICQPHQAALFIDYQDIEINELAQKLVQYDFYPSGTVNEANWDQEGEKLLAIVNKLVKKGIA